MRYIILIVFICGITGSACAQQRIRDLSMSPEESMRLPDVNHGNSNNPPPTWNSPNNSNDLVQQRLNAMGNNSTGMAPEKSFMAQYCDPNFRPIAGAMPDCIIQQRRQACQQFERFPADVQKFLERDMTCYHLGGEWSGPGSERNNEVAESMKEVGCSTMNDLRFNLVEKYRRETGIMNAILFFAEDTADADGQCMRSR